MTKAERVEGRYFENTLTSCCHMSGEKRLSVDEALNEIKRTGGGMTELVLAAEVERLRAR